MQVFHYFTVLNSSVFRTPATVVTFKINKMSTLCIVRVGNEWSVE